MRSRIARVLTRVSVLLIVPIAGGALPGPASSASAAPTGRVVAMQGTMFETLSTPVGLAAVGLGITGMVAGTLRRKKVPVQPENERR